MTPLEKMELASIEGGAVLCLFVRENRAVIRVDLSKPKADIA